MKQPFIFLGLCVCALCGCGKKDAASDQNKAQPTPEQTVQMESEYILPATKPASATAATATRPSPGQPRPNAVPPARTIQERINGAIHAQMTVQLRMYMEKNGGRMPESFSEFANVRLDSIPRPPDGKKWVIDIATLQVKAVSAKQ